MASQRQHRQNSLLRLLLYALGVSPQDFFLVPNAQGWVSIKELTRALQQDPDSPALRESAIIEAATIVAPDKLEISPSHIRARQRETLALQYAVIPPGHLYLGLRPKNYALALEKGLSASDQTPLILLPSPEQALLLARRCQPDPVTVTIKARQARENGAVFDLLGTDMYLCQHIPPACLLGPAPPETPARKGAEPAPSMGSVIPPGPSTAKPYRQKGIKKNVTWKRQRQQDRRSSSS
jgi:putative RNA 2'-phosphotransferase